MTKKNARELIEKPKRTLAKIGQSAVWRKLFINRIDLEKVDEIKRETLLKHGPMKFWW